MRNTRYAPAGMVCGIDHLASSAGISMHDRLAPLHEEAEDLLPEAEITRRRALIDPAGRVRVRVIGR